MTDFIYGALLSAPALLLGARIGGLFSRVKSTPKPPKPDKCTSYKQPHGTILHDCGALRSHVCLDGRCSFHCNQMCKCASPGVA